MQNDCWLEHVLDDLAAYAKQNDLDELMHKVDAAKSALTEDRKQKALCDKDDCGPGKPVH